MKKELALALAVMAIGTTMLSGCGSSTETAKQSNTSTAASAAASAESSAAASSKTTEKTQIANPWTDSDQQGVAEATGIEMTAPEGASGVAYSYMSDGAMAQMTYALDGMKWTYRAQMADELTDISGMTYSWSGQEEGTVSGRDAVYYVYNAPDNGTEDSAQVVNWYDVVTGTTYSLSVSGKDLDGMDLQAYAEQLYAPAQGDATGDAEGDSAAELEDFLGEHTRSYDESTLTVAENSDGTLKVDLSVTRLCSMENGVGTFNDHKITFETEDPGEGKLTGVIYKDSDNSLTVEITDSTWEYLPNGEVLNGFGK